MPELPEVESVRLSLKDKIVGKKIIDVNLYENNLSKNAFEKMFRGVSSKDFLDRSINCTISSINRRGKYLLLDFNKENLSYSVYVHLGMAGALMNVESIDSLPKSFKNPKNLHVKMKLSDGSYLVFSDIRRFGKFAVLTKEEFENINSIKNLGPEPFSEGAEDQFILNLSKKRWVSNKKDSFKDCIKVAIMDQSVVAGVGNIYACESLFLSKIDPKRKVSSIKEEELRLLFKNFRDLMKFSILVGGTTVSDYVNGEGMVGSFQNHLKVYHQKKCCDCGSDIRKIELDRTTFYCPRCQK